MAAAAVVVADGAVDSVNGVEDVAAAVEQQADSHFANSRDAALSAVAIAARLS